MINEEDIIVKLIKNHRYRLNNIKSAFSQLSDLGRNKEAREILRNTLSEVVSEFNVFLDRLIIMVEERDRVFKTSIKSIAEVFLEK